MAKHDSENSMIKEALQEYIEVAKYCVVFDKAESESWANAAGCYGYPAGLLLLSTVDAIGTIVMGGGNDVKQHFTVLNHPDYYGLSLGDNELEALRNEYRNRLSHNAQIGQCVILDIGNSTDPVIENLGKIYKLNLKSFYFLNVRAVNRFIELH